MAIECGRAPLSTISLNNRIEIGLDIGPAIKKMIKKLIRFDMNTNKALTIIPGPINGKTIRVKTVIFPAPKVMAASSYVALTPSATAKV